jgi:catechol 2,3-dioxygenase-like lactoylglutathione lyase family enzyme
MPSPDSNQILAAKLANVVLTVADPETCASFYEAVLGFRPFYKDQTSCFLRGGGANVVLVKASGDESRTRNACLDVSVPDLKEAAEALAAAGVAFEQSDPAILNLHDPAGNLIEIVRG